MLALIQLSLVIPLHFFIIRNFVAAFGLFASLTSVAGYSIWQEMWVNVYGFTFSLAPLPYYFSNNPSTLKVVSTELMMLLHVCECLQITALSRVSRLMI